jgi:hypothetical protein
VFPWQPAPDRASAGHTPDLFAKTSWLTSENQLSIPFFRLGSLAGFSSQGETALERVRLADKSLAFAQMPVM